MSNEMIKERKLGCLETRMNLLIYSTGVMRSEEITQLLGVEPTESGNKGELAPINLKGNRRPYAHNHWFLISDSEVKSIDLTDHLNWFFDRLAPAKRGLKQLIETTGIQIEMVCIIWIDTEIDFKLSSTHLNKFAELGLTLDFQICDYGPLTE